MKELLALSSAQEALKRIKSGDVSAEEFVKAWNARVAETDASCHAWVVYDGEYALSQARAIDARRIKGEPPRALEGIPIGVKDIFNTRDFTACMGSPLFDGHTPGNDARVVHSLRQANAVIPGKTVTAEFAVHTPGKTVNPYHPDYSPGTSSSGSAAAVACAMVPLAMGTQTAGSIIRPASYCGVYGFKPSFGLIPRTGMLKTTDTLDQVGLFSRAPEDLQLLFDVVRVHGRDFPIAHERFSDPARQEVTGRPWRVGLVTDSLWVWNEASNHAREQIQNFARAVAGPDMEVIPLAMPSSFNRAHVIHETIYNKTLAYYFKEEFAQHQLISGVLNDMIRGGQTISSEQYQQALDEQNKLSHELDDLLANFDVILTLSTAGSAPKWAASDIPDSCLIWTLCGAPVINLPVFHSPLGLPFGAQILSRRYSDYKLLRFVEELRRRGLIDTARVASRIAVEADADVTSPL